MTARLVVHPRIAPGTGDISRLRSAGVDVELVAVGAEADAVDPLERVREGAIDLALVGSDALRGNAADGLTTVAVLPRDDFHDVLVGLDGSDAPLAQRAAGGRVGVHGARRAALLAAHRPDLVVVPLGSEGADDLAASELGLGAVVVSALEARRAGLSDRISEALDPRAWLPHPGMGVRALVARHPIAEATALDHLPTRTAMRTELALLDALDTEPDASLGCLAQPSGRWIRLWAAAASSDGARLVRSDLTGPLDEPEALGAAVARQLTERGISWVLEPVS